VSLIFPPCRVRAWTLSVPVVHSFKARRASGSQLEGLQCLELRDKT